MGKEKKVKAKPAEAVAEAPKEESNADDKRVEVAMEAACSESSCEITVKYHLGGGTKAAKSRKREKEEAWARALKFRQFSNAEEQKNVADWIVLENKVLAHGRPHKPCDQPQDEQQPAPSEGPSDRKASQILHNFLNCRCALADIEEAEKKARKKKTRINIAREVPLIQKRKIRRLKQMPRTTI